MESYNTVLLAFIHQRLVKVVINFVGNFINMETIVLNGKEYQLDIEQAKKLNLLKEKSDRVRSWEEFRKKYRNRFGYFQSNAITMKAPAPTSDGDQLTQHESKAISAFSKLLKLRRDWVGEWEPDWTDGAVKYVIRVWKNHICYDFDHNTSASLSFPTEQMAKEFLETFRELITEAKILI